MGKPTTQNTSFINHFSHPHPLQLVPSGQSSPPCSACKLAGGSGRVYFCRPCNFFLHETCSKMKQVITHPSHPSHTLTLLVVPVYDGGYFNCDACGIIGTGFSYQCSRCDFDIHALCAYKPLSIVHKSHPHHSLKLAFQSPYGANKGFSCDVCSKIGKNQWLYRCVPCEFDAHIGCIDVGSTPQNHHLQHSNSAPNPHANHVGQPQHQTSLPLPNQGNPRPRPRPNGPNNNPGRPNGPIGNPNGPVGNPNRPIRNPNRPMVQNAPAYGRGRQNNNMGYNGQVGPIGPNDVMSQGGQSFGEGSTGGSVYDDGSATNEELDVGVDVEVEYEVDVYEGADQDVEDYDEGQDVNADANDNALDIVPFGVSGARSESSFGGSNDARSQCNDLSEVADLYPQGPVRVNQGSSRGRRSNASQNSSNGSTPRSGRNGPRGGIQGSNKPVQNPRAPQSRRQNVRNRNNALAAGGSVGFNAPRDVGAFNGPPQGFNNELNGGLNNAYDGNNGNYNNEVQGADMYGGVDYNVTGYENEVQGADMYGEEENVTGYEENYNGDDYGGGDGGCDFGDGGDFVDDGYGDQGYDESYGENDFESYSDFTGGSESMYGDECYDGAMDDSQYGGVNGEPNNQFLPMVGQVGGPGMNNQNQYGPNGRPRNMGRYGRGGATNMNRNGIMNQRANNMQPRAMGRGANRGFNGPNGRPNGPNGNTPMNNMVQGLCQGLAVNMLLGVGGDVLGGGGGGGVSSALGGLFGGESESQF